MEFEIVACDNSANTNPVTVGVDYPVRCFGQGSSSATFKVTDSSAEYAQIESCVHSKTRILQNTLANVVVELESGRMKQPIEQDCNGLLIEAGEAKFLFFFHGLQTSQTRRWRHPYMLTAKSTITVQDCSSRTKEVTFPTGSGHHAEKGVRCKFWHQLTELDSLLHESSGSFSNILTLGPAIILQGMRSRQKLREIYFSCTKSTWLWCSRMAHRTSATFLPHV